MNCEIDEDMIVHIDIHSDYAQRMGVSDTINQLALHRLTRAHSPLSCAMDK